MPQMAMVTEQQQEDEAPLPSLLRLTQHAGWPAVERWDAPRNHTDHSETVLYRDLSHRHIPQRPRVSQEPGTDYRPRFLSSLQGTPAGDWIWGIGAGPV